jgi:hypothetical protein
MPARKAALRAAFLFCAIAGALLIPLPGLKGAQLRPALFHGAEDLGHPAVFGLLAFVIAVALRIWRDTLTSRDAALLGAALVGFGAASEALQHFTGRDASIGDFIGDVLGTWMGIALFFFTKARPELKWKRRMLTTSVVMAAMLALLPFGWTLACYAYRHTQRPVIWRADSALLDKFARRQHGEYPGLELFELPPDWRGFRELLITVHNPGPEAAVFFVRANDIFHDGQYVDRYNRDFSIGAAATQTYRIFLQEILNAPAGRKLDLSKMTTLIVFETRERGVHNIDVREISLAH